MKGGCPNGRNQGMERAGAMVILPLGLTVGGVTTWAAGLLNGLCEERRCVLVVHQPAPDAPAFRGALDPRVAVEELGGAVAVERAEGDVAGLAGAYARVLARFGGGPVAVFPCHLGDCYGACAELTRTAGTNIRVIGWAHSDNAYDARVLAHYERAVALAGVVNGRLQREVAAAWGRRSADVRLVASGVDLGEERDGPADVRRIVYVGRMDEGVKRVSALFAMSDELCERGVGHEVVLVGDGPAAIEVDRMIAARPGRGIRRRSGAGPVEVREELRRASFFVLPSRFEGVSLAMLEAMSESCCCVVMRENSGAAEVIRSGENGVLVHTGSGADARVAGADLAAAIAAISCADAFAMGRAARGTVAERFDARKLVAVTGRMIDEAFDRPARRWPEGVRAAFTARPGEIGSGTVPADADRRLRMVMDGLRGRAVAIHGTGRHSRELAHVLREYEGSIAAFTDDDPAQHGTRFLEKPVVAPDVLARIGATDVVISSHLHQDAIWSRRAALEAMGLRVHRLYA